MAKDTPYHDWRAILLKWLIVAFFWVKPLGTAMRFVFMSLSPSIPNQVKTISNKPNYKRVFFIGYCAGLFFCLILTMSLCLLEGTLWGEQTNRMYFNQDIFNILLYSIVCPTYIGLAFCIISNSIFHWSTLVTYADKITGENTSDRRNLRTLIVFVLALLLCAIYITNYMQDVLNPILPVDTEPRIYWFMNLIGESTLVLNKVGYYYVVLNFILLFSLLIACACFIGMASEVLRCGDAKGVDDIDSFDVLAAKLEAFTLSYTFTKALVAALAVNTAIWAVSPLGKTDNLVAAQFYLTIIGVFFVAVPRHYVELRWYELWNSSGKTFNYIDTRSAKTRLAAQILDGFFIASLLSLWKFDFPSMMVKLAEAISA
jgi:hypothetical protein